MPPESSTKHWHRLLLISGLLMGFTLRIYQLGSESLWYDETVSAFLAGKSVTGLIAHTARDIHPPAYYLLLHLWKILSGPTLAHGLEFLFAWPSLVFGVLILALLYPIGRRLLGRETALLGVWLAAVNPFHLWYSQEVRMYTLGAALGLLCLWAVLRWHDHTRRSHPQKSGEFGWLAIYAIAAALGLYTLYYFAFLLIAINLMAMVLWYQQRLRVSDASRAAMHWIAAQIAALVLWSPWWLVFWRQITEPPVPPWRELISLRAILEESLAALVVGQSPPGGTYWPWAVLGALLLGLALASEVRRAGRPPTDPANPDAGVRFPLALLTGYTLTPLAVIYILSLFLTPLYHVRYLFTYAPAAALVIAAAIQHLKTRRRWLREGALAGLLLISGASLSEFWYNPLYRTDDHRAAVAELAANWRPGDALLVNAGWVYTALEVYWPHELVGFDGVVPPELAEPRRLTGVGAEDVPTSPAMAAPLFTTGSVDGPPSLGWGLAESDFYPMAQDQTAQALATLAATHTRIWHYRLYDTVSDPQGFVRQWLTQNTALRWERPYPGRDYLRVQLFETTGEPPSASAPIEDAVQFGDALLLASHVAPANQTAGGYLYTTLNWQALEGLKQSASELRMSLRLYPVNEDDAPVDTPAAQVDAAPLAPTTTWEPGKRYRQPLALPVAAATPPGVYWLELVTYGSDDGVPLAVGDSERSVYGQRWRLGQVRIQIPPEPPEINGRFPGFDYIDLAEAKFSPGRVQPGGSVLVDLVWRPRPNEYRDTYTVVLSLLNSDHASVASWRGPAGRLSYPSGDWAPAYPVRQQIALAVPDDLAPGQYTIALSLERASDGMRIPAHRAWLPWPSMPWIPLGEIDVQE